MSQLDSFRFGLETEYLLVNSDTFQPYWHKEIEFKQLNGILESIPISDIPPLDGLELEPPHQKLMPYVVEGYHLPDMNFKAESILPKGVEIRTPVCSSIHECLQVHELLFNRMQEGLQKEKMSAVALSHHPFESNFRGPQNKRRHDFWLWAMEVMTTYGPDINIGVPEELMKGLDHDDFAAKINYYAAAMTAFSVAAPFSGGKLWEVSGHTGKSFRTYRRSVIAPPIEIHPHEGNRLEFKVFDMSPRLQDYENFFLLFLTLLLDNKLSGRASNACRIYQQGNVAIRGWEGSQAPERAAELLAAAERTLPKWGFDPKPLASFEERLRLKKTPADELIQLYRDHGSNMGVVLRHLSRLIRN